MWEYEVITIDYDAKKIDEGIKGHKRIAETLSAYAAKGWEVVTAISVAAAQAPMFVLRRAALQDVDGSTDYAHDALATRTRK